MKKRVISLLLVLVLIIGMVPVAFATSCTEVEALSSQRVNFSFGTMLEWGLDGNDFPDGPFIVGATIRMFRDNVEVFPSQVTAPTGGARWITTIGDTTEFRFEVVFPSGWVHSSSPEPDFLRPPDFVRPVEGDLYARVVLAQDILNSAPFNSNDNYFFVRLGWSAVPGASTPQPPEPPPQTVYPFIDVRADAWYASAVEFVHQTGIMSGTSPTTFTPNVNFTRAMLVTTLHRMAYGNASDHVSNSFTDVPNDAWFAPYVSWANEVGIAQGTSTTTFSPNAPVSRQDFAVFMHRFADYLDIGIPTSTPAGFTLNFSDADNVGAWAQDALRWAVYNELVTGTGQLLDPRGTATRAQSATILMRFVQTFLTA